MPLEENTYDEIPSGRVETLVQAIDKIEKLEMKLKIAVEALKEYADEFFWDDCKTPDDNYDYIHPNCAWYSDGYKTAQEALAKIKELDK